MDFVKVVQEKQKYLTERKGTKSFISTKIVELLNYRINEEEKSSRLYKSMSLWLENEGYFNSAKLWEKYSCEELKHADWAREYLLSFGIRPETRPIGNVVNEFSGLDDIIYKTYEHETIVTEQCKQLSLTSLGEQDLLTFTLGQKYVSEQVEEMNKVQNLVDLLKVYGNEKLALALLDHELEKFV